MMFLQYSISGATAPILSHYLKNQLHFAPLQVGIILAMTPIAGIIAPLFVVQIANRFLSETRLLALCHFMGGCVGLALATQESFWPFLLLYTLFGVAFMPTFALTNSITLHNVIDAKRDFGRIRFWGPVSWVVVALGFSKLWLSFEPVDAPGSRLYHAIILGALASFALSAYALTLPKPHAHEAPLPTPGWSTFRVFLRPGLLALCVITLLNSMIHQFYYYGMGPYLSQIGFKNSNIMPLMSLGQLGEMAVFWSLGFWMSRFGIKTTLLIGIFAQVLRCLVFATGNPWLTIAVIPTHGLCFACYFAVAFIYVDTHSGREHRAGAQQLFNSLMLGFGNLFGNLLAGVLAEYYFDPATRQIAFAPYWMTSAIMATAIGIGLAIFFKESPPLTSPTEEPGLQQEP